MLTIRLYPQRFLFSLLLLKRKRPCGKYEATDFYPLVVNPEQCGSKCTDGWRKANDPQSIVIVYKSILITDSSKCSTLWQFHVMDSLKAKATQRFNARLSQQLDYAAVTKEKQMQHIVNVAICCVATLSKRCVHFAGPLLKRWDYNNSSKIITWKW